LQCSLSFVTCFKASPRDRLGYHVGSSHLFSRSPIFSHGYTSGVSARTLHCNLYEPAFRHSAVVPSLQFCQFYSDILSPPPGPRRCGHFTLSGRHISFGVSRPRGGCSSFDKEEILSKFEVFYFFRITLGYPLSLDLTFPSSLVLNLFPSPPFLPLFVYTSFGQCLPVIRLPQSPCCYVFWHCADYFFLATLPLFFFSKPTIF